MAANTAGAAWVANNTRRLSYRSASTPPNGPNSRSGRNCSADTTPSAVPLPVSSSTSHDWATRCIQVPDSEITCPVKYSR